MPNTTTFKAPLLFACHGVFSASRGSDESWYLDMWRRIVFPPTNTDGADSGSRGSPALPAQHKSTTTTTTSTAPQDFLRAVGNHLPDSAVNGLWALFHSIVDDEQATRFFMSLSRCGPDLNRIKSHQKKLSDVVETYEKACSDSAGDAATNHKQRQLAEKHLMRAVAAMEESATPICERWFHQTTALPNGIRWLMELRRGLLQAIARLEKLTVTGSGHPHAPELHDLKALDERLLEAFRAFFSKQYLLLEELTWKTTPPYVLERVIASESVHPFAAGLESLKLRIRGGLTAEHTAAALGGSALGLHERHLFALYHPAVADEPLISVQVALCGGIESSVDRILLRPSPLDTEVPPTKEAPKKTTAIFYSINNAQPSLRGIELGSMLIKRVVSSIITQPYKFLDSATQQPHAISEFSTLSPMPGFMRWLRAETAKLERGQPHRIFGECSEEQRNEYFGALRRAFGGGDMTNDQVMFVMTSMFTDEDDFRRVASPKHLWFWNKELTDALRVPLMRSAASYLVEEKRRGNVLDPVGNFHIGNGATLYRINWLANCSVKGSMESACMMVNYRYDMHRLGENATRYALEQVVPVDEQVRNLL